MPSAAEAMFLLVLRTADPYLISQVRRGKTANRPLRSWASERTAGCKYWWPVPDDRKTSLVVFRRSCAFGLRSSQEESPRSAKPETTPGVCERRNVSSFRRARRPSRSQNRRLYRRNWPEHFRRTPVLALRPGFSGRRRDIRRNANSEPGSPTGRSYFDDLLKMKSASGVANDWQAIPSCHPSVQTEQIFLEEPRSAEVLF